MYTFVPTSRYQLVKGHVYMYRQSISSGFFHCYGAFIGYNLLRQSVVFETHEIPISSLTHSEFYRVERYSSPVTCFETLLGNSEFDSAVQRCLIPYIPQPFAPMAGTATC
jgi:hypothetical protein